MKVLDAFVLHDDGKKIRLSEEEISKDLPMLEKSHEEAKKRYPTWDVFGGFLNCGEKVYQVAD